MGFSDRAGSGLGREIIGEDTSLGFRLQLGSHMSVVFLGPQLDLHSKAYASLKVRTTQSKGSTHDI